ncbi:carbamoyl phosphate synthase large subunit [Bacillus testis]|uniref:carbamoyl phosphate synthase large subunit n=1 Tax=Bacillus testis TaxID=1622072 RepID=UPI00067E9121|nr:carbamoyl phosphate synthase large subunit [Bacillus testis]
MPKDNSLQTILVIGSGPIVIGQAAEFDYGGTQACLALKEEGYKVILINNNPATIMTDEKNADVVYFEPLTKEVVTKIIEKERPDGLLATLGGQTGLNLAYELDEAGVLEQYKVKLLGTPIDSIKKGEDRELFRELMLQINEPVPDSKIIHSLEEAMEFADEIGFPIIIRPAYTLGGTGGGIASDEKQYKELVRGGLQESPITQCLVERSIAGFKEIEYEVMRDASGTCITVCNMENIDPVGIHTGDSIVVAPSQTLTDEEYQMLRSASIKIISALGIIGGCNIQFALDPKSKQYFLIEVNPRVSRSSALASKATGYPIARIAAKLSVGYLLSELVNPVTKSTYCSFEPALDYVVVKFPRWPFDKFGEADRKLGTQMKATGEVMAIDRNLESAIQKAAASLEKKLVGLKLPKLQDLSVQNLYNEIRKKDDERFFVILELLRRGEGIDSIHQETQIDYFFLHIFAQLVAVEKQIEAQSFQSVRPDELALYKELGFGDQFLAYAWNVAQSEIREKRKQWGITASYKMVDTCGAEFESKTSYFYSSYSGENEQSPSAKQKVLILGSGPIRIGQGIEFDYCSVHSVLALQEEGIESIMINNNPETVSTDFATADKLYFEPLTLEYVLNVIDAENITDVIVQFGGQTAINLAGQLEQSGIRLLGTSFDVVDQLEDRDRFYSLLDSLDIPHVPGYIARDKAELLHYAQELHFPVLVRPSYVIGGAGMKIYGDLESLKAGVINSNYPILIDSYIAGTEAEVDLVADGDASFIPLIAEHIERAGIHSGDSMAYLPAQNLSPAIQTTIAEYAEKIVKALHYSGLMNIQYVIEEDQVYVLEVNPRASRTIPIISKVSNVPMVQIATKLLLGKYKLDDLIAKPYSSVELPYYVVKYPVFSTFALSGLDSKLGPEMKSTGEGIAIGTTKEEALAKAFTFLEKNVASHGEEVFVSPSVNLDESFRVRMEAAGLNQASFPDLEEWLRSRKGKIILSLEEDEKVARLKAAKYRLMIFTSLETFAAYIEGAAHSDALPVVSLGEWHEQLREGVVNI